MGCDRVDIAHDLIDTVSIHAPVWGATDGSNDVYFILDVSIHAPVWGATIVTIDKKIRLAFQSTHPCGVRRKQRRNLLIG